MGTGALSVVDDHLVAIVRTVYGFDPFRLMQCKEEHQFGMGLNARF